MSRAGPGAPPCNGPFSAPSAPTTAETRSDPVDVITLAVNVDAFSPWSMTVLRYVSSPRTISGAGTSPRSRYRKSAAWPRSGRGAIGSLPRCSRQYVATMVGMQATIAAGPSPPSEIVPAAARRASIGSRSARAQSRSRLTVAGEQIAGGCQCRAEGLELHGRWEIAVPQKPGGLLEGGVFGKLPDGKPGNNELTSLAIDVTQSRRSGNDTFQPAAGHRITVRALDDRVNID